MGTVQPDMQVERGSNSGAQPFRTKLQVSKQKQTYYPNSLSLKLLLLLLLRLRRRLLKKGREGGRDGGVGRQVGRQAGR